MTLWTGARSGPAKSHISVQKGGGLAKTMVANLRGDQFDRQRNPVQLAAHSGDEVRVVVGQRRLSAARFGALDEQLHSREGNRQGTRKLPKIRRKAQRRKV